jgi:hypothetical protein
MAARAQNNPVRWRAVRGRNGWDNPSSLPIDMAAEAENVVWERSGLARKRYGTGSQSIGGDSFSGTLRAIRAVLGQSESAAQLFIVSGDGTTKILRVTGGTSATNLTLKDAVAATPRLSHAIEMNGKLYIAYDSTANRLHVYDPNLSTSVVRRVGLATPAAPTVANTGSGTYAAQIRYYRIQWKVKSGTTLQRQSLLGTSLSFTPSGTGTHARVTQPALPSEGETHWVVFGSSDDDLFYDISGDIAIATTTYDDNEDPDDYDNNENAAPSEGAFTPWPSVKYLATDGNRLLGFGVWESAAGDSLTPRSGRVYFSPVLDSSDADDDERVSNVNADGGQQGWIDVGRNAGGEDRAIAGPINGQILVFQSNQITALSPTGDSVTPYRRAWVNKDLGAVSQWSTFMGQDENGRPCVYFLDPQRGPYRYGDRGFEWCGYDVQDLWAIVDLSNAVPPHGAWDKTQRRVNWMFKTTDVSTVGRLIVLCVDACEPTTVTGVRYGWARWTSLDTGGAAKIEDSVCSVMFSTTFGATMGLPLSVYGSSGSGASLARLDDTAQTDDFDLNYVLASITSPVFDLAPPQCEKKITKVWAQFGVNATAAMQIAIIRDYGIETRTATEQALAAAASETRRFVVMPDLEMNAGQAIQFRIQNSVGNVGTWLFDECGFTWEVAQERAK